jgi:hypothetical protein
MQAGSVNMSVDETPVQPAVRHTSLLARHPLVFYFLITYAGTWLLKVPIALSEITDL